MIVNAGEEKPLAPAAWTALWAAVAASAWRKLPAECAHSGLVDDMGNMWTLTIVDGPDRVQHECSLGDDTTPEATLAALDQAIAAAAAL